MKTKPILFNTEMTKAILDGRKGATRRIMKPQLPQNVIEIHNIDQIGYLSFRTDDKLLDGWGNRKSPYQVGDILYVRETWCNHPKICNKYYYRANSICNGRSTERGCPEPYDHTENCDLCEWLDGYIKWHPSIHMPKSAARIFLKVTDVRCERLCDISEKQAKKEGVTVETNNSGEMHRIKFAHLWNSTIKKSDIDKYGWLTNPYVWVIEFERCEKPKEEI